MMYFQSFVLNKTCSCLQKEEQCVNKQPRHQWYVSSDTPGCFLSLTVGQTMMFFSFTLEIHFRGSMAGEHATYHVYGCVSFWAKCFCFLGCGVKSVLCFSREQSSPNSAVYKEQRKREKRQLEKERKVQKEREKKENEMKKKFKVSWLVSFTDSL